MKDNETIDKLAEQYATDEEDAKIYQKAQQSTIITQTRQINELRKKIEEMSGQLEKLTIENTKLKALGNGTEVEKGNDAETICLVQLALLNNYSMQRELTLEETKKAEIFTKTLVMLRNKQENKEVNTVSSLSNEELLEAMKSLG
jgi:TolA-binding protein